MTSSKETPIIAIGQMLGKLAYDPFAWYAQMRSEHPVYYDEQTGVWSVFRYDDVKRALEDKDCFSSHFPAAPGSPEELLSKTMYNMDPPKHTQMRSIVNRAFTSAVIQQWERRIQEITDQLLSAADGRQEIDLVRDFSNPLPIIVIAELLGIPSGNLDQFKQWSDSFTSSPSDSSEAAVAEWAEAKFKSEQELAEFFGDLIEAKRHSPDNDIISILIQAEEEGMKLSADQLVPFCVHLLAAGNESTSSLITNAVYSILETPGLYDELRNDLSLVPQAVEEALRYRAPFQVTRRLVKQDVEIGGKLIRTGQVGLVMIGSANRDESKFKDAHLFDIRRKPNPHLSLGQGIHFCLGAPLVRLEAAIAMTSLLTKYSALSLPKPFSLSPAVNSAVYGLRSLSLLVRP